MGDRAARSVIRLIGIVMMLIAFYAFIPLGTTSWLLGFLAFLLIMLS